MRIESSQQMLEHIESGGTLTLNNQGQLETQGAVARFFQKIGDTFRSLTASGRAAIEARNTRLYEVMTNLIRADALVNPAQTDIQQPEIAPAQRNVIVANLAIARELASLPPEARAAAKAYVIHALKSENTLEQGAGMVSDKARQIMRNILSDPILTNGLKCSFRRSSEELQPLMDSVADSLRAECQKPTQQARVTNGIHESFVMDCVDRPALRSLNGQPPVRAGLVQQLTELIPDEKIRAFISQTISQAGLEGSLYTCFTSRHANSPNPDTGEADLLTRQMHLATPIHSYELTVENGRASIRLDEDVTLQPQWGTDISEYGFGGTRYAVVMDIDLTQDMTGKAVPDFTIRGECSPIDPD